MKLKIFIIILIIAVAVLFLFFNTLHCSVPGGCPWRSCIFPYPSLESPVIQPNNSLYCTWWDVRAYEDREGVITIEFGSSSHMENATLRLLESYPDCGGSSRGIVKTFTSSSTNIEKIYTTTFTLLCDKGQPHLPLFQRWTYKSFEDPYLPPPPPRFRGILEIEYSVQESDGFKTYRKEGEIRSPISTF